MSEDKELFYQAIAGVSPLKHDQADVGKVQSDRDFAYVQRSAVEQTSALPALSDAMQLLAPEAELAFKRSGIQQGVYKKLRLGKYEIQAQLDLHGMTVDQARKAVAQLRQDCLRYEVRVVLIVHGKGKRSEQGIAYLKSHLAHWLTQFEQVQAFHSAQLQHGGTGAVYVLLRKSEHAKQRNREKHRGRA